MFSSLLLAGTLSITAHMSAKTDTVPKGHAPTFATEGDWEAHEIVELFRHHYKRQTYSLFGGMITLVAPGTYRFDSLIMRMSSTPEGMMGLLSRGLLYPGVLDPIFGSIDTLSIVNIIELKALSKLPQVRWFSCWVFSGRRLEPTWYIFELTNKYGTTDMDMANFIQNARLTFLYQAGIII
jgi:hypothetical protein